MFCNQRKPTTVDLWVLVICVFLMIEAQKERKIWNLSRKIMKQFDLSSFICFNHILRSVAVLNKTFFLAENNIL